MYHGLLHRRNWFWAWWLLFSTLHLLVSASYIFCYGIWELDLTPWVSARVNTFIGDAAANAFNFLNLPIPIAAMLGVLDGSRPTVITAASVMIVLDAILYGLGLSGILWMASFENETRPRYLGLTPRVVGRGLILAIAYWTISFILGLLMLADSVGLLTASFTWQNEIDRLLRVMHPLMTVLDLDPVSNFKGLDDYLLHTFAMMLDSAVIGVLVVWGWTWLLPTLGLPHKASLRR